MNTFLHDLQYALRQLRKSPGFTLTAVLTLALGIAANTTIFSWIDSTLFDPIPGVAHTGNMITLQRGERSEHPSPAVFLSRLRGPARCAPPHFQDCWPITTITWPSPAQTSPSASTGR